MANVARPLALVTGATGTIGSHLVRRLLDEGWRVRALVRASSDRALLAAWGVELAECDFGGADAAAARAADSLAPHLSDADYVFHCAGLVSDWAPLDEMMRVNVAATRQLAAATLAAGRARRFVYLSSAIVFGTHPQRDIDESAPLIHTGDHYNLTKIRAEEVLGELIRDRGAPIVIVRPPYVYGPRDRQFLPRVLGSLKSGQFRFIGSGLQPMSLLGVGNLADALFLAATRPEAAGEAFVVTDGEAITRMRLLQIICEETGYPMPTSHVPRWLVRALCPIIEGIHSLKKSSEPPLINKFRLKFMATPLTYRIDKARRLLGYDPKTGTEAGLRQTLAWFRDNRPDLMPQR